ncbi:MAG: hypothetical protein IJ991_19275 [Thermoguttaceae bacterium]|nr:hypothetical protein [Thermoguttaceae bacterium]
MGERCYFGIERENGTVDAIYIHWCTNPKEAANDLRRGGYTTYEKVEELIGRGGASSILLDSKYDRVYDDMPLLAFESADVYVDKFRDNPWIEFLYLFRWKTKAWEYMVANACDGAYSERKFQGWELLDLTSSMKTVKTSIAELVEQGFEIEVPVNATKEEIFKIARKMYDDCELVVDNGWATERDVTILENEYIENNGDFPMERF